MEALCKDLVGIRGRKCGGIERSRQEISHRSKDDEEEEGLRGRVVATRRTEGDKTTGRTERDQAAGNNGGRCARLVS